jgi:DNA polymerase-3 subunit epsilon
VGLPKWTLEEWAVDFIALDFETANADLSSICQVGAVVFENGQPKHSFSSLVDPQDYFDPINTSIHGISEDSVRGAPTLAVVHAEMHKLMSDKVVVCHSAFDRAALRQAEQRHALESIACEWLDTTMVVRRAWPKYASKGYGLENLARDFGIEFQHHNAVEDARATGVILLRAIAETRMTLGDWILRVKKPINLETAGPIKRAGNAEGPFFGEVAVFTGALSMPRHEAADMAAAVGCQVDDSVTKSTTLLIVGDQDAARLAEGQSKSSKQLKAERLIAKGQYIRILRETDFRAMSVEP